MLKFTPKKQERANEIKKGDLILNIYSNDEYYVAFFDVEYSSKEGWIPLYKLINITAKEGGGRWSEARTLMGLQEMLSTSEWRILGNVELIEL